MVVEDDVVVDELVDDELLDDEELLDELLDEDEELLDTAETLAEAPPAETNPAVIPTTTNDSTSAAIRFMAPPSCPAPLPVRGAAKP